MKVTINGKKVSCPKVFFSDAEIAEEAKNHNGDIVKAAIVLFQEYVSDCNAKSWFKVEDHSTKR